MMKTFEFTDCEQVVLLDLIIQCLLSIDINPVTSKHELPIFHSIDLREFDLKVLRSLHAKLDVCLV